METRIKEYFGNIKNVEIEKSAVAAHVWKEKRAMDRKFLVPELKSSGTGSSYVKMSKVNFSSLIF